MSSLCHVVEVTDHTHGPLAEIAAVAALKRSAAALGINLAGEPRVDWYPCDPMDPILPEVDDGRRYVTATAKVAVEE